MTSFEHWSLVIQALGAVGAIAVVVVAIWGGYFRQRLAGPRLRLRLRSSEGELTNFSDGTPARYYHLLAQNTRSWAPTQNVIVFLINLERPGPDGSWQSAMATGPIPLNWQFGKFAPGLPTLGPDRVCDIGRVTRGQGFEGRPAEQRAAADEPRSTPRKGEAWFARGSRLSATVMPI
jgi:hypothetical protein